VTLNESMCVCVRLSLFVYFSAVPLFISISPANSPSVLFLLLIPGPFALPRTAYVRTPIRDEHTGGREKLFLEKLHKLLSLPPLFHCTHLPSLACSYSGVKVYFLEFIVDSGGHK
jgi:hypothetical protein